MVLYGNISITNIINMYDNLTFSGYVLLICMILLYKLYQFIVNIKKIINFIIINMYDDISKLIKKKIR